MLPRWEEPSMASRTFRTKVLREGTCARYRFRSIRRRRSAKHVAPVHVTVNGYTYGSTSAPIGGRRKRSGDSERGDFLETESGREM